MRAYIVETTNGMGFEIDTRYFSSLSKAKKVFKSIVKEKLKSEEIATDEEEVFMTHGSKKYNEMKFQDKRIRKEICIPFWYCSSTEDGTEYDITREFIVLKNIEIE